MKKRALAPRPNDTWPLPGRLAPLCLGMLKFALVPLALLSGAQAVYAEPSERCPSPPVVTRPVAVSPYESEARYAETTREVRQFIRGIVEAGDREADATSVECAKVALRKWASGSGLLSKPDNFEGGRARIRYAFALNIAALKLGITPSDEPEIIEWLGSLSRQVASDFARHRVLRKSADNLYVWSGATAASFLLLAQDKILVDYQEDVWNDGLKSIRQDGTVRLEVDRGTRSVPYHTYYLSALLWLSKFREHLGSQMAPDAARDIARLDGFLEQSICASGPNSERPPSTIAAESLQVLDSRLWAILRGCGIRWTDTKSVLLGGEMTNTLKVIDQGHAGSSDERKP